MPATPDTTTTKSTVPRFPRVGRTLPPVHVPITPRDIAAGVVALFGKNRVRQFEDEVREYFKVPGVWAVSSGKAALVLALQALRELAPDRDEVLLPAYTCYSVPAAVVAAGLKVRLCDLASESLDMDQEALARHLENERLLAVVPTHLYGVPADVARVRELAHPRGVFVIEDAAQSMGAEHGGTLLGTSGDIGIFSMGRGKSFSTVEGGLLLTADERIAGAVTRQAVPLKSCGFFGTLRLVAYAVALMLLSHPLLYWLPRALPFLGIGRTTFDPRFPVHRLSRFQAGMTARWQVRLASFRLARCRTIREMIQFGIPMAGAGGGSPEAVRFPVLVADRSSRDRILARSDSLGLGITPGYPDSLDRLDELVGHRTDDSRCRVARKVADHLVTLPVHSMVTVRDREQIAAVLNDSPAAGERAGRHFLSLALLLILWLLVFIPLYPELVHEWLDNSDNSHAFLVPFISAFLVWQRRDRLAKAPGGSSLAGGFLLATSLAIYLVSVAGGSAFPGRVAMVAALGGLLWFCLGSARMRLLAFPVAFLVFMVPIPYSLLNLVAGRLQLMATAISERLILGCSIPVYREGNMLYFVQTQLEVAEACSGIRSIVSLTMISLVFCFLSRRGWWRKVALVSAAVPIAIVANIVRVSGTGVLAHFYGDRVARGFLHEFSGMVIFFFGFALLFALFQAINRRSADDRA